MWYAFDVPKRYSKVYFTTFSLNICMNANIVVFFKRRIHSVRCACITFINYFHVTWMQCKSCCKGDLFLISVWDVDNIFDDQKIGLRETDYFYWTFWDYINIHWNYLTNFVDCSVIWEKEWRWRMTNKSSDDACSMSYTFSNCTFISFV